MIFLSAQSDELYYKWQLEVQLVNFKSLGIKRENIHVLVSYDPLKGLNPLFSDFFEEFAEYGSFFTYIDSRYSVRYSSSIRPHIIKKHFLSYPDLSKEVFFYHDCDIIFRELPDIRVLKEGDTWYVSDTREYLGADYIKSKGDIVFSDMCKVIGISEKRVLRNDHNSGGAQYVLKNLTFQFWEKVEMDCEKLFRYLADNNKKYQQHYSKSTNQPPESYHELQRWCADMWALLWNAFLFKYKVEIHPDLDFCWPSEPLEMWSKTKIFHNSGVEKHHTGLFCKARFINESPFTRYFDSVDMSRCSFKYVEKIQECMLLKKSWKTEIY